jgi:predicted alpha/beta-fold hydrolase
MGDFGSFDKKQGRIANVSIPLLMVQSLDDPVGTWRSFHDPNKSVATGSGNTVILFTRKGGHVGWPQGINPRLHGWSWMNNVASSFVRAIGQAQSDVASSSN